MARQHSSRRLQLVLLLFCRGTGDEETRNPERQEKRPIIRALGCSSSLEACLQERVTYDDALSSQLQRVVFFFSFWPVLLLRQHLMRASRAAS